MKKTPPYDVSFKMEHTIISIDKVSLISFGLKCFLFKSLGS